MKKQETVPLLQDEENEAVHSKRLEPNCSRPLPPAYDDSVIYKPNNIGSMHGKINEPPPSNHFVMALVTLVCCCWPISLGALIKSNEVNRAYIAGDITRAKKASAAAKKYSIISIVVGAILWILVSIWIIYFYFVFFPKMMEDGIKARLNTLQEQLHTLENLKSFATKPATD